MRARQGLITLVEEKDHSPFLPCIVSEYSWRTRMRNDKIVYLHLLDNTIVYIGSGGKLRINSKTGRTTDHLAVWDKLDKVILKSGLSDDESKDLEQELINKHWYTGKLLNRSTKSNKVQEVVFEVLDKILYYDESSPSCLRWKSKSARQVTIGDTAGYLHKKMNYHFVGFNGSMLLAHRIVYCLCTGKDLDRELVIDHINGDGSDNTIRNLRAVSQSDNSRNRKSKVSNTGESNISESKDRKSFKVKYINADGVEVYQHFSYGLNGRLDNPRAFRDRDLALAAAIKYRDELISLGKIYRIKP